MQPLRIGVSGAGRMGAALCTDAQAAGATIVAVHDVRTEAAAALAAAHPGAIATTELDAFFAVPMDGLLLCTIPTVRIEPVRRACARGIHLLIEKPPAYTLAEARECQAAISAAGVLAAVGFNLRYDPRLQRLRELIAGHDIHLARTVCTINYYLDFHMSPWFLQKAVSGGPIAEQAIHLLDAVRYVCGGARATRASAMGIRNMALDRHEFDAENAMQLMYQLENGVMGVHTNHCGHEAFAFDLELIGPHLRLQANATEATIHGRIHGQAIDVPIPAATANKVSAWLRAIATGDATHITSPYADSLHTQALIDGLIRSLDSGATVDLTTDTGATV